MRVIAPVAVLILAASAAVGDLAGAPESSEAACEVLKQAAVDYCLSRTDLTGRYYCDPLPAVSSYFVLGLRYRTTPDELVGSNLVGWFAVSKSTGAVSEWDINEDQAEPIRSGCPFEAK